MGKNISAVGTSITISGLGSRTVVVTDFADDQTPFDVQAIEIGGAGMNINGMMPFWQKSNMVQISIGVIPDSKSDYDLHDMFCACKVRNGGVGNKIPDQGGQMVISQRNGITDSYFCVVPQNLPPGHSASNDGRFTGKVYTFFAEDCA